MSPAKCPLILVSVLHSRLAHRGVIAVLVRGAIDVSDSSSIRTRSLATPVAASSPAWPLASQSLLLNFLLLPNYSRMHRKTPSLAAHGSFVQPGHLNG
jgi:hypothetical protein